MRAELSTPLVSVIIPAYNAEGFISEAIQSVLDQSYPAIECIVINDGSKDGTLSEIKKFEGQITVIDQRNSGVSGARNAGLRVAQGEWISFLDADDLWDQAKIANQLSDALENNCLAHTSNIQIKRNHFESEDFFDFISLPMEQELIILTDPTYFLLKYKFAWLQSSLLHRSISSHLFNESISLYEDFEWLLISSLDCKWAVSKQPMTHIIRRENEDTCLSAQQSDKPLEASIIMLSVLKRFREQRINEPKAKLLLEKSFANQLNIVGNEYSKKGELKLAAKYYFLSIIRHHSLKSLKIALKLLGLPILSLRHNFFGQ